MWDDQNDSYCNKDIRESVLIISELWQNIKLPFSIWEVATFISEKKAEIAGSHRRGSALPGAEEKGVDLDFSCTPF